MEVPTLNQLTKLMSPESVHLVNKRDIISSKIKAGLLFLLTDATVLTFSFMIGVLIRNLIWDLDSHTFVGLTYLGVTLSLLPITFLIAKLYPGYGIDVIDEIRTIAYSTTIVFGTLAIMSFLFKELWEYSRFVYLMTWVLSLPLLPLGRSFIRNYFSGKSWWGIPVMIVGAGKAGDEVIKSLQKHINVGLRPVVAIDDNSDKWGYLNDVPVVGGIDIIPVLKSKLNIDNVIIAMPSATRKQLSNVINLVSKHFTSTTIIPELYNSSSLWVSTRNINGLQGLEVQQKLITLRARILKRVLDLVLTSILIILASPIFLIVPILIMIDSKGKVFFNHTRVGLNNTRFKMIKFRTMHKDAEKRLTEVLNSNEDFKKEYNLFHKLKDDPRLTRVGKFLRKFSIDELPNFFNVLKGDMSLIGPRAYMPSEINKIGNKADVIFQVKPGVTGLWQVTEGLSFFESRVNTDVYYLSNWSMFMDIYIFARTIAVVLMGKNN
jgi:Undecaprenyl-phosphate galactose phosphotransferase WbaP